MRIAILGATGHVSKCALWVWAHNQNNEFFLFSRSKEKLMWFKSEYPQLNIHLCEGYEDFEKNFYDVIFNGTGFWDMPESVSKEMFVLTETFDNMILEYQKQHPNTKAIHISSGAAYANDFKQPISEDSKTELNINYIQIGDYYSVAKINSEAKHRAHSELSIVDIRLFGFFSRFMSLEYRYLLSAMIKSVLERKTFICTGDNFWRDYIHMNDFMELLNGICERDYINESIDVRSLNPISRDEIFDIFINDYQLYVAVEQDESYISKTGVKPYYYSTISNSVYTPKYSSKETLRDELAFFLGGSK